MKQTVKFARLRAERFGGRVFSFTDKTVNQPLKNGYTMWSGVYSKR